MHYHLLFDILAYAVGGMVAYMLKKGKPEKQKLSYGYYTSLLIGVFIGAFTLGTLNTLYTTGEPILGKSVMGAIFGGIIAVEIHKKLIGYKGGSTGAYFVPSLAIGICIGRIGCFFGGLEDQTCGIETSCFVGYDFGDGILRHPVQLYESAVMGIFFLYSLWLYVVKYEIFEKKVFYYFVLCYALQRFVWEFLKPYESVVLSVNVFQICSVLMFVYAMSYLYLQKDNE